MYYKTSEIGEDEVCEAMREYAAKSFNSGKAEGKAEGRVEALLDFVNKGTITLDRRCRVVRVARHAACRHSDSGYCLRLGRVHLVCLVGSEIWVTRHEGETMCEQHVLHPVVATRRFRRWLIHLR